MHAKRTACLCAGLLGVTLAITAEAQRVGGGNRGDRGDRVRPPESVPAIESYAPMTASVFEVLSVRASERVVRLRGGDGKTADVYVEGHVYDVSKLKAGDKVKVDFFQPDQGDAPARGGPMAGAIAAPQTGSTASAGV